jgi:hypothetical protein
VSIQCYDFRDSDHSVKAAIMVIMTFVIVVTTLFLTVTVISVVMVVMTSAVADDICNS